MPKEEFEKTKKVVGEFEEKEGKKLQEELVAKDKANKKTSYISKPWYDMYLESRDPLPINVNPFIQLAEDPLKREMVSRGASLIRSAVRFYETLKAEKLEPDVFVMKGSKYDKYKHLLHLLPSSIASYPAILLKAYPLDMSQYKFLFGTSRVPKVGKDSLQQNSSLHAVVVHNNCFYKLFLYSEEGKACSEEELAAQLKQIVEEKSECARGEEVCLLTTENRDVWAKAREELITSSHVNSRSLEEISSAMFVVSLEKESHDNFEASNRQFLHGEGRNRWFDKSFSLILDPKGNAAVNFEHSWGDGVAVLRFVEEVHKDSLKKTPVDLSHLPSVGKPHKLEWRLSAATKEAIREAGERFDCHAKSVDYAHGRVELGASLFKKKGISPDGTLQMAFQIAYYKMYGSTVSTYESASTAAFKHGRTETIRSATVESLQLTRSFLSPSSTTHEKREALHKAAAKHSLLTREAVMGQGCDRHLFALRDLSRREHPSSPLPTIFTDPSYSILNQNILSTSTLTSPSIRGGGFGPVHSNGFGVGYGVMDEFCEFNVTSYSGDTKDFVQCIIQTLKEIEHNL